MASEKPNVEVVENVDFAEPVANEKTIIGLEQARLTDPPHPWSPAMLKLYMFCIVGFLCSSMNGFDGSLMSSLLILTPFQEHFGAEVDGTEAGIITAMYQIGSACSLPFIAQSMDWKGRRFGMFIGCLIICIGTLIQGLSVLDFSNPKGMFYGGRFMLGFGVSLAASSAPTYIIEVAHPAYRGTLTGLYNIQYTIGSILATGACRGSLVFTDNRAWLIPTWCQMIFPGFVVIFSLFLPETPRWLYTHERRDEALDFITKYHGLGDSQNAYVTLQVTEFEEYLDFKASDRKWWDYSCLFTPRSNRYRVACNIVMAIIPQFASGGIGYYSGAFMKTCGITNPTTILNINLGLAFVSPFSGYFGASFCDKIGRRKQFLGGLLFVTICWVALTPCTALVAEKNIKSAGIAAIFFSNLSGVGYCFGFTPLQALYPVEVLSYEMRAKGMAFNSFVLSAVLLINQFAAPIALATIGWKYYLVITVWDVFQFICAYFFLVETLGYTLEELDDIFKQPNPKKASLERNPLILQHDRN
jgi:sugar porter (SP) family MFS transporter